LKHSICRFRGSCGPRYFSIELGLPYFNPHSFRKTLAQLGQKTCRDIETMKAWSQNLGHEDLMTTFTSYGTLQP
jgi:integrase